MRTKFPTAFIIVRSWLKYVFNCVGIIIFVFVPNRMVSFTDILYYQSSFLLILSFVEFLYMRWRFLDISVALNESLHSNLFVFDVVIPFLVLALYIFLFSVSLFTFNSHLSLFTFNLFYTHIILLPPCNWWELNQLTAVLVSSWSCLWILTQTHGFDCCMHFSFVIWGMVIPTYTLYVTLLIIGISLCILI